MANKNPGPDKLCQVSSSRGGKHTRVGNCQMKIFLGPCRCSLVSPRACSSFAPLKVEAKITFWNHARRNLSVAGLLMSRRCVCAPPGFRVPRWSEIGDAGWPWRNDIFDTDSRRSSLTGRVAGRRPVLVLDAFSGLGGM